MRSDSDELPRAQFGSNTNRQTMSFSSMLGSYKTAAKPQKRAQL